MTISQTQSDRELMSQYKQLLAQKQELDKKIADARKEEVADAISQIRTLMQDFNLSVDDLAPAPRRLQREKVEPKFRDPATGATWTGRGKPPAWIKDKNREDFAIKS